jgi:hypothetical protein
MHTRETLGLGWWRSAALAGKLALWMSIAVLLVVPMPSVLGLAAASASRPNHAGMQAAGNTFRHHSHAHPPARPSAQSISAAAFTNGQVASFDGLILPTLSGRVVNANGSPFTSSGSPNTDAGISAISFDGSYSFTNLAGDGTFSIALEEGIYEISVWLNSTTYPSVAGPEPFYISVSSTMSIGDIALVDRSVTISGNVAVLTSPAIGVPISAWDAQGEQFSTSTDSAGNYILTVTPGDWQIAPDLLDTTNYIFSGTPRDQAVHSWSIGDD